MGILSEIIRAILHLSCVAIDMTLLLLLFRILGQWRPIPWVQQINAAAQPIVDPLTSALRGHWETLVCVRLTLRGTLALSVLTLSLVRCLLCAIAGVLP
ncbi:MAG: hypothetical protein ABFE01_12930 [Phycisphaerales bacterium]|jgi:hypothetical protein